MDDDRTYTPPVDSGTELTGDTPGALLRAARERRRLSEADLADMTRLPIATIQALENDDHQELRESVYVRGYYRKCAAALDIPSERLLELYRPGSSSRATNAQVPLSLAGNVGEPRARAAQWTLILPTLVILIGVIAWFLYGQRRVPLPVVEGIGDATTTEVEPVQSVRPSSGGISIAPLQPFARQAEETGEDGETATPPQPATVQGGQALVVEPSAPAPAAAEPVPAGAAQLVLDVSETSWARIEDATGQVLVNRVLQAGEQPRVSGRPPFSVVIGYAPGVSLSVDGRSFDFSEFVTASSTARFSVPVARP